MHPHTELLSMSLLPKADSEKAIIPFEAHYNNFPAPAYFFDVTPTAEGPFIVGASGHNANSGKLYNHKHMAEINRRFMPDLHRAFLTERHFRQAVAENPAISKRQLLAVSEAMDQAKGEVFKT